MYITQICLNELHCIFSTANNCIPHQKHISSKQNKQAYTYYLCPLNIKGILPNTTKQMLEIAFFVCRFTL